PTRQLRAKRKRHLRASDMDRLPLFQSNHRPYRRAWFRGKQSRPSPRYHWRLARWISFVPFALAFLESTARLIRATVLRPRLQEAKALAENLKSKTEHFSSSDNLLRY